MAAPKKPSLSAEPLEPLILRLRDRRVMLDADLARLYGVTTKRFNEALKRNQARFPEDFAFRLTGAEFSNLRSQIATSSSQPYENNNETLLRSQTVISSSPQSAAKSWGGSRHLPLAFTEHGALMAASILHSDHAVQMSVFVIRAFVRMREQIAANTAILKRLAEIDDSLLEHDTALRDVYRKLLPLLNPPPDPPKRRIGFNKDDD